MAEVAVQLAKAAEKLAAAQEAKLDVKPDMSGAQIRYLLNVIELRASL